ncbi:MAG TPA: cytochrome C, partial [Pseudomonas sp.]|nr:cytochrome C [Pseudomonas sp.]
MNTHLLPTLLALFVSGAVLAAEIKMDDQSQLTQKATKGAGERY